MGTSSAQRKDFEKMMEEAKRQGWSLKQTSGSHWLARPPDPTKTIIYFAISGDPHAFKNVISDMRKRGFVWPPPQEKRPEAAVEPSIADEDLDRLAQEHFEEHALNGDSNGATNGVETPPPPETPEQRMERLFTDLRDSKTYLSLADSELAARERELVEATKRRDDAREERARAAEKLRSLKAAFDEAFQQETQT